MRRSRGYVPGAIPVRAPVRAAGSRLRRASEEHVLHRRRRSRPIWARTSETWRAWRRVAAFEEASRAWSGSSASRPEIVAHDLHPLYASTLYALGPDRRREGRRPAPPRPRRRARWPSTVSRARSSASPTTGRATGPTARPGAARSCSSDEERFERLATFRARRAARRREAAIREVWRIALALRRRRLRRRQPGGEPSRSSRGPGRGRRVVRHDRRGRPDSARTRRRPLLRRLRRALLSRGRVPLRGAGRARVERRRRPGRERGAYPFEVARSIDAARRLDLRPDAVRAAVGDSRRRARPLRDLRAVPQHGRPSHRHIACASLRSARQTCPSS